MTLDDALQGLQAQFGVPPGPPGKGGRHYYRFGELTVGLAQAHPPGFLCARTCVGTVDLGDEAAVARVARASMDFSVAPDALVGLDGTGNVYLDLRLGGGEMTHDHLLDSIERLIDEASRWKQAYGKAEASVGEEH